MLEIVIQYLLVVLLILGLTYLIYVLKDKGADVKEDYYGIAYTLFTFLTPEEATTENIKRILRAVSKAVNFIETNYKNEENSIKEEKALILATEAIDELNFQEEIDKDTIRYLIRLCASLMLPTNKTK